MGDSFSCIACFIDFSDKKDVYLCKKLQPTLKKQDVSLKSKSRSLRWLTLLTYSNRQWIKKSFKSHNGLIISLLRIKNLAKMTLYQSVVKFLQLMIIFYNKTHILYF